MSRQLSPKGYSIELIDQLYSHVPAFTDVFDEETWYMFVICFVMTTFVLVFILSRFITIRPAE